MTGTLYHGAFLVACRQRSSSVVRGNFSCFVVLFPYHPQRPYQVTSYMMYFHVGVFCLYVLAFLGLERYCPGSADGRLASPKFWNYGMIVSLLSGVCETGEDGRYGGLS